MNNMKKAYPCHLELRGLSANDACALCGHEAREHRWYPHRKTQEDAILRDALREASRDVQIMRDARKNAADVLALRAQVEELRAQLHAVEQKNSAQSAHALPTRAVLRQLLRAILITNYRPSAALQWLQEVWSQSACTDGADGEGYWQAWNDLLRG